jgi:phage terminase large subunit-like protein
VFLDGRAVPADDYKWLKMNPMDTPHVSEQYLKLLEQMSAGKRKRFLEGEYSTDGGALWKRAWITYAGEQVRCERVVVGVDPSGTVGGDEIGIVVVGRIGVEYLVLDDYSLHGTPGQWAGEVGAAYEKWQADMVVAERNYGGDMVASTIR